MQHESSWANGVFSVIKGAALALAFSFVTAIIFACVLRAAPIPDKAVYPITQTLKVLAIVLGTLVFVKGEKGWLKGIAVSLVFTALSYLAFSAIGGDFSLSWLIFAELALALIAGVVSGIVAVNIKK